jgi:hypothetical protein
MPLKISPLKLRFEICKSGNPGAVFRIVSRGLCYDHNFRRKYKEFLKLTDSSISNENANLFAKFLGENIFKIITSVPGDFLTARTGVETDVVDAVCPVRVVVGHYDRADQLATNVFGAVAAAQDGCDAIPRRVGPEKQRPAFIRVTRLGEFSPNGRLFTLDSYSKTIQVSHIFGLPYSMDKFKNKFRQKWVGLYYLVTLVLIWPLGVRLSPKGEVGT